MSGHPHPAKDKLLTEFQQIQEHLERVPIRRLQHVAKALDVPGRSRLSKRVLLERLPAHVVSANDHQLSSALTIVRTVLEKKKST